MANIMNLKSLRNKVSRNGFDLSFKRNFTAKVGELLPVMVKEVLPGDVFNIDLSSFTRTQPVNTAAFARMREYYDFFFVPYNLLWNKADTVLTQMYDNAQHSTSGDLSANPLLSGNLPYVSCQQLATHVAAMYTLGVTGSGKNFFGYNRGTLSAKLLEYLGYGNYSYFFSKGWSDSNKLMANVNLNVFSLLAYQKIYSDFYRDSQWEKTSPGTFNVDYISGNNDLNVNLVPFTSTYKKYYNMCDLRYCNWQKDLFHGIVPNQQYGVTSAAPIDVVDDGTASSVTLNILVLRQYEFLQKWKEIAQSGSKDYKEQIQKHWNVSVGDYASEMCQYLGGTSSNIDINEVVNTNITGDNAADIAGKGIGVSRGNIRFDSRGKYGVLMCIYHCLPVLDYTTDYIEPLHTKVEASAFAIPELDRVGMQPVPLIWLSNPLESESPNAPSLDLGYAPRYIEYKTSFDSSVGAFKDSLNSWVMSYGNAAVRDQLASGANVPEGDDSFVTYTTLKVNPNSVDPIFAVKADSGVNTDQFLCSCFFDIKAVRNLDVDGLPY